jgi:selenocysteine-specific elongation factor
VIATVKLYGKRLLEAGADAFGQLRFSAPLLLVPGDRFIIRQFSPVITIGGGVVLENRPPARVKNVERYIDFLHVLGEESREPVLRARIAESGTQGLSIREAVARTGWTQADVLLVAAGIPEITNIAGVLISNSELKRARQELLSVLDHFHKQEPLAGGMPKENLRERMAGTATAVFSAIFDAAIKDGQIAVTGDLVHLPGRRVVMKDEESESRQKIERAFAAAGLKVPALKDVLQELNIDKSRAQKLVTLLLRERVLVKVSDDLVFHHTALAELRKNVAAQKTRSSRIDVGGFKDLTGISRKYAIPLLEYLDRERVTRRVGDYREIL